MKNVYISVDLIKINVLELEVHIFIFWSLFHKILNIITISTNLYFEYEN